LEQRIVVATEWVLRVSAGLAIIFALLLLIQHQFLVYSFGYVSSVSFGSAGALFILSEYAFSNNGGMSRPDAIIFGILFPAAFLSTYEIVYHFSFLPAPGSNELFQIGNDLRYLATEGVLLLPLVFLRKRLKFTKISGILVAMFVLMWFVWFLYGFPQYYTNGPVYYPPTLKTTDYWDTSLFYNFDSKTVLAVFFASILNMSYQKETRKLLRCLRILK
jgi:hypothetical protein